jgi:hypothetical protein
MGFLRSIESRIEGAFEGTFGRAFRANVEPVELARKLAKELEDGKVVSVSQVYAPNEYTVFLNPKDRERFSEYEASLRTELSLYLAEHARREGYVLATRPRVLFETEPRLGVGTFGIATRLTAVDDEPAPEPAVPAAPPPPPESILRPDAAPAPLPPEPAAVVPEPEPEPEPELEPEPVAEAEPEADEAGLLPTELAAAVPEPLPTPVPEPVPVPVPEPGPPPIPEPAAAEPQAEPVPEPVAPPLDAPTRVYTPDEVEAEAAPREQVVLVLNGRRLPLDREVTSLGRSSGCDVVLDDANASRRHAELRVRGGKAVLVDLDSTNGTAVNGRRVREHPLADGDRITIGTTALVFERKTT